MPGRGAAGKIDQLNERIDALMKRSDRWMLRALKAEKALDMAEAKQWVCGFGGCMNPAVTGSRQDARCENHAQTRNLECSAALEADADPGNLE